MKSVEQQVERLAVTERGAWLAGTGGAGDACAAGRRICGSTGCETLPLKLSIELYKLLMELACLKLPRKAACRVPFRNISRLSSPKRAGFGLDYQRLDDVLH